MFSEIYELMKKEEFHGFLETVESNAIWLDDDYFVRLNPELLEIVSKLQLETDPTSYKERFEKNTGEIVYLYDNKDGFFNYKRRLYVNLDKLSCYKKGKDDVRIVEKDSLMHHGARQMAQYFFDGKGQINDFGTECAIALMLYLRNGCTKKDFWEVFTKEFINGLEELLDGKESLETEKLILANPFPKERNNISEIVDFAKKEQDDDYFHIIDSELAEFFKKSEDYVEYNQEVDNAVGQYAMAEPWYWFDGTKEEILARNNEYVKLLTMESILYYAAQAVMGMIYEKDYFAKHDKEYLSIGVAIYKKNGRPATDFWRALCRELIEQIKSRDY